MTKPIAKERNVDDVTLTYADEDDPELVDALVDWLSRLLDDPSFDESPPT